MYYEVYVDILFLENLWINAMLLLMVGWAGRLRNIPVRIMTGASFGSLGACILTIFSAQMPIVGYFLGNFLLAAGMVVLTFSENRRRVRSILYLYAESFVLNGFLHYVESYYMFSGIWFVIFCSISALFLLAAERFLNHRKKRDAVIYPVKIKLGTCEILTDALYDTGNNLCDPFSGQPVSILSKNLMERLFSQSGQELVKRMIPYRTITESGVLEAYILDQMEIHTPKEIIVLHKPEIACMPMASGQYPLILHRDLLSS